MVVEYSPSKEISKEERERIHKEIENAKKMPIVYDEDCPALTPKMEEAFRKAVAERNARKTKQHA